MSSSRYLPEEKAAILARARSVLAGEVLRQQPNVQRRQEPDLIYKTQDDARDDAARDMTATETFDWQWVTRHCDYRERIMQDVMGEVLAQFKHEALEHCNREVGVANREIASLREQLVREREFCQAAVERIGEEAKSEVALLRNELGLARRELDTLRAEVGLERGLRALQSDVEQARSEIPKVPAIVSHLEAGVSQLEAGQERLQREMKTSKDKLTRVRTNQCIADYRLSELRKATEARAREIQMKFETTVSSFTMREIHPDAGAVLRDFAAEALKGHQGETIWHFDPGPTAGTA
jgi:septation ring formation regulator EzrA